MLSCNLNNILILLKGRWSIYKKNNKNNVFFSTREMKEEPFYRQITGGES